MSNLPSDDHSDYMSDGEVQYEVKHPKLNENFSTTVIIANLPQVPESKVSKLTAVLGKLAGKVGALSTATPPLMPMNGDKTHGFAFITFQSSADATKCVEAINNYQFDKSHKLSVHGYDDVYGLRTVQDTYVEAGEALPPRGGHRSLAPRPRSEGRLLHPPRPRNRGPLG